MNCFFLFAFFYQHAHEGRADDTCRNGNHGDANQADDAAQQPSQRSNRVNVAVTHGSEGYDCPPESVAYIFEGLRLYVAFDVVHQNARET